LNQIAYPYIDVKKKISDKFWVLLKPHLKPRAVPACRYKGTGMKDVSAKGRKNLNQMLKQVEHGNGVGLSCFVIPNQILNPAL